MEFGRNSNRRFAVKNKEIKQIFFPERKTKNGSSLRWYWYSRWEEVLWQQW